MARLSILLPLALAACASPDLADRRVTIDLNDTTLAAVIDQYRRQVPETSFKLEGWRTDFRIKRVVIHDEPWREALVSLLDGLEGEIWDEPARCVVRRIPRVTFAARNASPQAILTRLERESGTTILLEASPRASTLTMSIKNVSWIEALKAVASVCGCKVLRLSSATYRVAPADRR